MMNKKKNRANLSMERKIGGEMEFLSGETRLLHDELLQMVKSKYSSAPSFQSLIHKTEKMR